MDNYKLLLKGLSSKNQYVFSSIHKILKTIGNLKDKVEMFIELGVVSTLLQQYTKNINQMVKKMALELLLPLVQSSSASSKQIAGYMANFGVLQQATEDVKSFSLD